MKIIDPKWRDAAELCEELHDYVQSKDEQRVLLQAARIIRREAPRLEKT